MQLLTKTCPPIDSAGFSISWRTSLNVSHPPRLS